MWNLQRLAESDRCSRDPVGALNRRNRSSIATAQAVKCVTLLNGVRCAATRVAVCRIRIVVCRCGWSSRCWRRVAVIRVSRVIACRSRWRSGCRRSCRIRPVSRALRPVVGIVLIWIVVCYFIFTARNGEQTSCCWENESKSGGREFHSLGLLILKYF